MRRVVLKVAADEASGAIGPWQEPDMPEPLMKQVGQQGGGGGRGCHIAMQHRPCDFSVLQAFTAYMSFQPILKFMYYARLNLGCVKSLMSLCLNTA